jgi:acyl-CoA thioester hydrolase
MDPAPLELFRTAIRPEWVDYNGHMNVAYYMLVFDKGTDILLERLGIGATYRQATDHTVYVLEAHLTYEREVKEGEGVRVAGQVIAADEKRLHVFHRMFRDADGALAATNELLFLHVEMAGPRARPFPPEAQRAIATLQAEQAPLPRPPQLGRSISLNRRGSAR